MTRLDELQAMSRKLAEAFSSGNITRGVVLIGELVLQEMVEVFGHSEQQGMLDQLQNMRRINFGEVTREEMLNVELDLFKEIARLGATPLDVSNESLQKFEKALKTLIFDYSRSDMKALWEEIKVELDRRGV